MRNTSNARSGRSRDNTMPFTAGVRPGAPDRRVQGAGQGAFDERDGGPRDRQGRWDRRGGGPGERPVVPVASYPDYVAAQRAVDYLSDRRFPVDRVTIVGTGVRIVERVLGRMTTARAALAGAGSGAWFGLLVGILFGIFAVAAWWKVILFAVVAGLIWGAAFGAIAHAAGGGRRDFTSVGAIEADDYTVLVDAEHADEARRLLAELPR